MSPMLEWVLVGLLMVTLITSLYLLVLLGRSLAQLSRITRSLEQSASQFTEYMAPVGETPSEADTTMQPLPPIDANLTRFVEATKPWT